MSIAIEQNGALRPTDGPAANDDTLGYRAAAFARNRAENSNSETGGWDAYEVWRRLIKEARDRRAGGTLPQ